MSREEADRRAMDLLFQSVLTESEIVELNLAPDKTYKAIRRIREAKRKIRTRLMTRVTYESIIKAVEEVGCLGLPRDVD